MKLQANKNKFDQVLYMKGDIQNIASRYQNDNEVGLSTMQAHDSIIDQLRFELLGHKFTTKEHQDEMQRHIPSAD